MCGIFGHLVFGGKAQGNSLETCFNGLKRLEYRGYDSAGIAGIHNGNLHFCKAVGKVDELRYEMKQTEVPLNIAIAHTRWATHGESTLANAHPHCDVTKSMALVHNGIIENYQSIRCELKLTGCEFVSETDSEVMVQYIAHHYKGDLLKAAFKAMPRFIGSFAFALIHKDHPDEMIAATKDSPLVIGLNQKTKEFFVASDTAAFCNTELEILFLEQGETAHFKAGEVTIYNKDYKRQMRAFQHFGSLAEVISKEGHKHFMHKEMGEQPGAIQRALSLYLDEENGTANFDKQLLEAEKLLATQRVIILGCGTSLHAGYIAASMIQERVRIHASAEIASEFRYTNPLICENTLILAISQSGETADTLAAVREAKAKGARVIAICNVEHSTLAREADQTLLIGAGPEVSVCSTKAFTSQLTTLSLFVLYMARMRHMDREEGRWFVKQLKQLPACLRKVLQLEPEIASVARKYASYRDLFFIGRRHMFYTGLEAALKLKEISYLNAVGYAAGEMKHGPIALIDENLATIALLGNRQTYEKIVSNLMEIKARRGPVLAFAPENATGIEEIVDDIIYLPTILSDELAVFPYSVATQLFAYYVAEELGCEIDQPRNLAKSVTVE